MASALEKSEAKKTFPHMFSTFVETLKGRVCTDDGQWAVKGFIDAYRNVYSISSDTKITSKILEIHIFPILSEFANASGFDLILAEHQNHYPDISFVTKSDDSIKFAVDLKTTYRKPLKAHLCNGFTLGSHGAYFQNRTSRKNIRFPYAEYAAHFCLGVIYDRAECATIDETIMVSVENISSIASVMSNLQFFLTEKWQIASDRRGSGNTANIGSIELIDDILAGAGMFSQLGEQWFDDYWINYGNIQITDENGGLKKITKLSEFVEYRQGDQSLIVPRRTKP